MKQGAYDIGRKAVYLIVVVFVLAVIFIYADAIFGKFQVRVIDETTKIDQAIQMNKIMNCITIGGMLNEDYQDLKKCNVERSSQIKIDDKIYKNDNVELQAPYWVQKRFVMLNNELKVIEVNIQ